MDPNGILIWGLSHSSNRRRHARAGEELMLPITSANENLPSHLHLPRKTPDQFFDYYGRQWPWSQLPKDIQNSWSVDEVIGGGLGVRPNGRNTRYAHVLTWVDDKLIIEEGTKAPTSDERTVLNLLSAAFMRRCELVFRGELETWVKDHIERADATPLSTEPYAQSWYILPQFADDFMAMAKALDGEGILMYAKLADVQGSGVRHEVEAYLKTRMDTITPTLLKNPTEEDRQKAVRLLTVVIPAYDEVFGVKSLPTVARGMALMHAILGV